MIRKIAAVVALCLLLGGCSMSRVMEREAYWQTETDAHLPVGTTKADAEAFFAARGLKLRCCIQSEWPWMHMASEHAVGGTLLVTYDVVVFVEFSADQKVSAVRVHRLGLGP